jgi:two-component system, NarL family, sensor kinase
VHGTSDQGTGALGMLTSRAAVFGVAGLMALTLVGAGSWFWGQRTGMSQAIRDARARTETLGARIVQANVIGGLIAGDPTAVQAVDRLVSDQDQKVVGVTLSSVDGHAVYSKNPAVLGTTTPLDEAALQSLQAGQPSAELGVPSGAGGDLVLRVNQPTQPPGGEALLLQVDYDSRAVMANGEQMWQTFAPVTLGTLLLLGVVWMGLGLIALRRRPRTVSGPFETAPDNWLASEPDMAAPAFQDVEPAPAAVAAAGRVEHQHDESGWFGELRGGTVWPAGPFTSPVPEDEVTLPGALRAETSGPSPSLEALRPLATPAPEFHANGNGVHHGVGTHKRNGTHRGDGQRRSLETVLSGMLLPLARRGIDTRLDLPAGLRLPSDTEELLLWAAEEAVQNTMAHGQAQTVKVRLDVHNHRVELTVDDDGRGFDPDELTGSSSNGQVSLHTLTKLAANAGGALRVHSAPNRGTRLHLDLPAR